MLAICQNEMFSAREWMFFFVVNLCTKSCEICNFWITCISLAAETDRFLISLFRNVVNLLNISFLTLLFSMLWQRCLFSSSLSFCWSDKMIWLNSLRLTEWNVTYNNILLIFLILFYSLLLTRIEKRIHLFENQFSKLSILIDEKRIYLKNHYMNRVKKTKQIQFISKQLIDTPQKCCICVCIAMRSCHRIPHATKSSIRNRFVIMKYNTEKKHTWCELRLAYSSQNKCN